MPSAPFNQAMLYAVPANNWMKRHEWQFNTARLIREQCGEKGYKYSALQYMSYLQLVNPMIHTPAPGEGAMLLLSMQDEVAMLAFLEEGLALLRAEGIYC